MFNHVILENKLFYNKDDKSIIKNIDNYKVILVLDFLQKYTNKIEIIGFTLERMITFYDYKIGTKKGESVQQFKNILAKLQELEIIECLTMDKDNKSLKLDSISPKQYIECKLNVNKENGFIQLFFNETATILTYVKTKIDNVQLLALYCYLKSRMYKHKKGDDVVRSGGKAETCYCSFELIHSDIGLSKASCMKYIDILVELNLIRYSNAGLWYYPNSKEVKHESPNIYCLYEGDEEYCKHNLKEGIKQYKNSDSNKGKIFIASREYKNNNKKLNGEKGSIIKKINNGTATEQDEIRLKELESLINGTVNEEFRLIALFKDINENIGEITLSEYYDDYKDDLCKKYYSLENNLGLWNNGELTVNYEYYKWIMTNYKENEHEYYVHCVRKNISNKN